MILQGVCNHTRVALLLALFLVLTAAQAHDMWIEPSAFRPAPGAMVAARFRVGEGFVGDPLPRDPNLIREFVVESAAGRRPVPGRPGMDPAGLIRAEEGLAVIGYRSHRNVAEQAPEKFRQYLKEEGLNIRYERRHGAVRELFSRCAKSLILTGPPKPGQRDRLLGFALELVAERNPYALRPDGELPVRLLFEGKPLAGAQVVALNKAHPERRLVARSDRHGRVRFVLHGPGPWLVKAVHMIPAAPGLNAEWESFWASLTFELPAESEAGGRRP